MKKMLTLATAALIGLSVVGAAPALAHSSHGHGHRNHGHFHGHKFKLWLGYGHKVKFCYFDHYYDEVICQWRWVGY